MIFIIYQMGTPDYSICRCSARADARRAPGAPTGAEHTVPEPDVRIPRARELCTQQPQQRSCSGRQTQSLLEEQLLVTLLLKCGF